MTEDRVQRIARAMYEAWHGTVAVAAFEDQAADVRSEYLRAAEAVVALDQDSVVTEHATCFKSGDHKIRCDDPEIEDIYPLAQWIVHGQRFGGKVCRRRVIVVDDWEEVPKANEEGL